MLGRKLEDNWKKTCTNRDGLKNDFLFNIFKI